LLHHRHIVNIHGHSYGMRDQELMRARRVTRVPLAD